jgi:hypothetical protein
VKKPGREVFCEEEFWQARRQPGMARARRSIHASFACDGDARLRNMQPQNFYISQSPLDNSNLSHKSVQAGFAPLRCNSGLRVTRPL